MTYTGMSVATPYTEAEVDRLQRKVTDLEDRIDKANRAFSIVAEALHQEAIERDWCGEYDDFVDEVNAALPTGFALEHCRKDYEIEATITVRVRINHEDRSKADAEQWFEDNQDDLIRAFTRNGYSSSECELLEYDLDSFEVEES